MKRKQDDVVCHNGACICAVPAMLRPGCDSPLIDTRGFSIIELLLVIVILGILATIAIPAYSDFKQMARLSRCIAELRSVEKEVTVFVIDRAVLPDSVADFPNGVAIDPWGHAYEYNNNLLHPDKALVDASADAVPYNDDFDIYSKGPDGETAKEADPLDGSKTLDDIVRANDGLYVGIRNL